MFDLGAISFEQQGQALSVSAVAAAPVRQIYNSVQQGHRGVHGERSSGSQTIESRKYPNSLMTQPVAPRQPQCSI
jgi:hypothetical protein